MRRIAIRRWAGLTLFLIMLGHLSAPIVFGEEQALPRMPPPNSMNVAADALILRPVGLLMMPVVGLIYLIGYPFARAAGNEREVYQSLLGATIDFTFRRPLGRGEPFE